MYINQQPKWQLAKTKKVGIMIFGRKYEIIGISLYHLY